MSASGLRTNMTVSKIYHSREDRISELHGDGERVQYDGHDEDRVIEVQNTLDEFEAGLYEALEDYANAIGEQDIDEDSVSRISYSRREVIEKWALAQAALSKVAWALRFDGNVAYERMMNALKTGNAVDMRGL